MSSSTPHPRSSLLARQQRRPTKQKLQPRSRGAVYSGALLTNDCRQHHQPPSHHAPRPYGDQRQSPLLRLPSEIRLLIYSYLLPHAHDITFHPLTRKHPATGAPTPSHAVQIPGVWASIGIWTALLRTCRQLHDEGADALYGGNAFHFALTSRERVWAFSPPSLQSSSASSTTAAGGGGDDGVSSPTAHDRGEGRGEGGLTALNTPYARGLPINTLKTAGISPEALLRMRCLTLRVEEDLSRPEPYCRVQAWLRDLIDKLTDDDFPCSLQDLRVELVAGSFRYAGFPSFTNSVFWEFVPEKNDAVVKQWQFVLEPLAALRGVRNVEVKGHVSEAFAGRLARRMMMGVGDQESDRDEMEGIEYGTLAKSMRKFYEPELDWQLEVE